MKVIDKINNGLANHNGVVFSFEFFPPRTEEGIENLYDRMDRMVVHQPAFCDITWGAGDATSALTLDIANTMQNMICVETMMHLTCTNMPIEKLDDALDTVKTNGIQNILALQGDPPHGQDTFVTVEGGFSCALDLVNVHFSWFQGLSSIFHYFSSSHEQKIRSVCTLCCLVGHGWAHETIPKLMCRAAIVEVNLPQFSHRYVNVQNWVADFYRYFEYCATKHLGFGIDTSVLLQVRHIKAKYGDYFGITVAGYPEAHPEVITSESGATEEAYKKDLAYLKEKVDGGGEVIITQLFYDKDIFLKFVSDCREIGIKCPIVPGIMPIQSYKGFLRMTGLCKTEVPAEIKAALEPIKDNEEAVRAYGIHS